MAYDEARRQLLLFGGFGAEDGSPAGDRNSTWRWDGATATWTRIATTGPSPRRNAVMVYDATRERVVLFGGITGTFPNEQVSRETWEWNGVAWTLRADTGPSPRVHVNMGYDRVRSRVVVYGGFSVATMTELRDIWEWNGIEWTQSGANGPSGAIARGVSFDEKAGNLLLFSLTAPTGGTMVMDTYNGVGLTRLAPAAPNCILTLASIGPDRGGVISASTCGGEFQTALWSGTAWTTVAGPQPPFRGAHAVAWDRDRDRVVLFGGETQAGRLGDTWEFNGSAWVQRVTP